MRSVRLWRKKLWSKKLRKLLNQAGLEYPVHCCVCLNTTADRVPASAMVDGYLLCEKHAELAHDEVARVVWHGGKTRNSDKKQDGVPT